MRFLFLFVPFVSFLCAMPPDPTEKINLAPLLSKLCRTLDKYPTLKTAYQDACTHHMPMVLAASSQEAYKNFRTDARRALANCVSRTLFMNSEPWKLSDVVFSFGTGMAGYTLGPDSFGGSFGTMMSIQSFTQALSSLMQSAYSVWRPRETEHDALEQLFTERFLELPPALHGFLTSQMAMARTSPHGRFEAVRKIRFGLELTVHAPLESLMIFGDHAQQGKAQDQLRCVNQFFWDKLEHFFHDYDDVSDQMCCTLMGTVEAFSKTLLMGAQENAQNCFYVYLHGPGGIGKTFFAEQVGTWMREAFGTGVLFQSRSVNTMGELEGGRQAGLFLDVLKEQCAHRAHGGILLLDEASFLNAFPQQAKRVFQKSGVFEDAFLGHDAGRSGVKFRSRPLLVLAAGNDGIGDAALKSRFLDVDFPTPKRTTYTRVAANLVERWGHNLTRKQKAELKKLVASCENFRDSEQHMRAAVQAWRQGSSTNKWRAKKRPLPLAEKSASPAKKMKCA